VHSNRQRNKPPQLMRSSRQRNKPPRLAPPQRLGHHQL
jgi:hypothetical protein